MMRSTPQRMQVSVVYSVNTIVFYDVPFQLKGVSDCYFTMFSLLETFEDVDIGADVPVSSFPPVVIDRDAPLTSNSSSSSDSSGPDSGSSSDSSGSDASNSSGLY
eukprot:c43585_g1_i1 orf=3-317(+)